MIALADIRRAAKRLKEISIQPVNGYYSAPMSLRVLVDILLTYKRPRATKLYRSLQ